MKGIIMSGLMSGALRFAKTFAKSTVEGAGNGAVTGVAAAEFLTFGHPTNMAFVGFFTVPVGVVAGTAFGVGRGICRASYEAVYPLAADSRLRESEGKLPVGLSPPARTASLRTKAVSRGMSNTDLEDARDRVALLSPDEFAARVATDPRLAGKGSRER